MELDSDAPIDDALYSRQRYVLGDRAMKQLAQSKVFLYGLGALGVETAKNIALAGVNQLVIHDPTPITVEDLSGQFFVREGDISRSRAEASVQPLQALNPYVRISVYENNTQSLKDIDLSALDGFSCVVVSEHVDIATLRRVNEYCRGHGTRFIAAGQIGIAAYMFTDFGDEFEVYDKDGEAVITRMIGRIHCDKEDGRGVVWTTRNHGFADGDYVTLSEIDGMVELNGTEHEVEVINSQEFKIGDITTCTEYKWGGIATQVKKSAKYSYQPLSQQLTSPTIELADYGKMHAASTVVLALRGIDVFREKEGRLPEVWSSDDAKAVIEICTGLLEQSPDLAETAAFEGEDGSPIDTTIITKLCYTCRGHLPAISAYLGGILAQEVLKAVSGKFTPFKQWLVYEVTELCDVTDNASDHIPSEGDGRRAPLVITLGRPVVDKLASLKLFMIGAGAIGCEMLKNCAMHSMSTNAIGSVIVTDNDVIERSNLNRQFLFTSRDIEKHKSETACAAATRMEPALQTDPRLDRVGVDTENIYTDDFYQSLDCCVNALDNVQARLYVDSRCVTTQRPLIDSGTLGTKGHVQVVVPHVTESYGSTRDPAEEQVPFCTLKSFPNNIDHTIQWARDRFEKLFSHKPMEVNVFLRADTIESLSYNEADPISIATGRRTIKALASWPTSFNDLLALARRKFDKLFNHGAKNLLHAFPADTVDANGIPFWSLPRRQPNPISWDCEDPLHVEFVYAAACVWADIYGLPHGTKDDVVPVCKDIPELAWTARDKVIEASDADLDEKEGASVNPTPEVDDSVVTEMLRDLNTALPAVKKDKLRGDELCAQEFEKDDDSNHHIDFISAAANLRARSYGIAEVDRLHVKLIAGKITPAIATTTAAVSGLATIELIKLAKAQLGDGRPPIEMFRDSYMNLAIPIQAFSEPSPCARTLITEDVTVSLWDMWVIKKGKNMTVQDFIDAVAEKYKIRATAIIHGAKMIYVELFPAHKKRLKQKIRKLLDPQEGKYVDLTLTCVDREGSEVESTPRVRLWIASSKKKE